MTNKGKYRVLIALNHSLNYFWKFDSLIVRAYDKLEAKEIVEKRRKKWKIIEVKEIF